jgi:hypothetical protein
MKYEFRTAKFMPFKPVLRGPGFEDESITDWKQRWVTRMSSLQIRMVHIEEWGEWAEDWKDVETVVIPANEWYKE